MHTNAAHVLKIRNQFTAFITDEVRLRIDTVALLLRFNRNLLHTLNTVLNRIFWAVKH